MNILNYGSLNLDYVYAVPHFVQPGETLEIFSRTIKPGGKGLNQSVALARAGAHVFHAGVIGTGGELLQQYLQENGINTEYLYPAEEMQGHAVIQVNAQGENCILLYGGSNYCQKSEQITQTLSVFKEDDWLVLQNEINRLPEIVDAAAARGMVIVLNPSPYQDALQTVNFERLSWLILNEIEAEQLTGEKTPGKAWESIHDRWPRLSVLITLGRQGSVAFRVDGKNVETVRQPAENVNAVDTTGAGDTFTGYFIAGMTEGLSLSESMRLASHAAAISVTRHGAAESVPYRKEL